MPTIVLKSGTKWVVPPDCQSATVEVIGAGTSNYVGGGGAYSKSTGVAFTPGSLVDISVGAGASGNGTWLNTNNAPRYTPTSVSWSGTQLVGVDNTNNVIVSSDGITCKGGW